MEESGAPASDPLAAEDVLFRVEAVDADHRHGETLGAAPKRPTAQVIPQAAISQNPGRRVAFRHHESALKNVRRAWQET